MNDNQFLYFAVVSDGDRLAYNHHMAAIAGFYHIEREAVKGSKLNT
jgi:hypothetical protein